MICEDVWEFEFDEKFRVIDAPFPLREMPTEVINDLSREQCYAYRMGKMITTGVVDRDLLLLIIGQVQHSRWLITANRLCRLWVSKHGLTGENFLILCAIVTYIVCELRLLLHEVRNKGRFFSHRRSSSQTEGD